MRNPDTISIEDAVDRFKTFPGTVNIAHDYFHPGSRIAQLQGEFSAQDLEMILVLMRSDKTQL